MQGVYKFSFLIKKLISCHLGFLCPAKFLYRLKAEKLDQSESFHSQDHVPIFAPGLRLVRNKTVYCRCQQSYSCRHKAFPFVQSCKDVNYALRFLSFLSQVFPSLILLALENLAFDLSFRQSKA